MSSRAGIAIGTGAIHGVKAARLPKPFAVEGKNSWLRKGTSSCLSPAVFPKVTLWVAEVDARKRAPWIRVGLARNKLSPKANCMKARRGTEVPSNLIEADMDASSEGLQQKEDWGRKK
jgi:hypothetical protein